EYLEFRHCHPKFHMVTWTRPGEPVAWLRRAVVNRPAPTSTLHLVARTLTQGLLLIDDNGQGQEAGARYVPRPKGGRPSRRGTCAPSRLRPRRRSRAVRLHALAHSNCEQLLEQALK